MHSSRRSSLIDLAASLVLRGLALASLALAVALAPEGAAAEPVFSFDATPGKLPKTVVPMHYAIDLAPDLDKLSFAGSEVVDIEVTEPTARLVLNAVDMTIEAASVEGDAASDIALDAAAQTATLAFPRPVAAGRHRLRISFTGRINKFGRGLFLVDYPTGDGRKRMISSHLEPADARRIFPGWDEPAFKASFALTVAVPQEFLAVSNMPIAREEPAGDGKKRVAFQVTPPMSSYLFVLAAGDLERVAADANGVTVGVVAARGKGVNGRYALDTAVELLRYYNDYFGIAYPLPKLDLIAVPGGFGGAMENWGGIIFFESRLLFDPATSASDARRGIFNIIAHEMAHQWFGDLVTNAWWDNVWLNEGFASWMQAKSADALHPDWQTWLNGTGFREAAMSEDARRTTHPIQQPVANETEAMAAFDAITYAKGQAIIRMVENYLGEDTFRAGIRAYMRQHAYSNATTADLWGALEAASGKPVAALASAYTEQGGIPLVIAQTICEGGAQRIALRQDRFSVHDPAPKPQRWRVPVVHAGAGGAAGETVLLDGTASFAAGRCGEPAKLNFGDVGYYRVQYDATMLAALTRAMDRLAPADRANLIGDVWAMVQADRAAPAGFLDLIDRLGSEESRAVIDEIVRALTRLDHLEWDRPERAAFQAFARTVLRPMFERIGWDAAPSEPADRTLLRSRLIGVLGTFGDEAIIAEARRRFALFVKDPASLSTELRGTVTGLVGRDADRATYDTLLALGRTTTNTDERVRYYSAAASARNPALAQATLAIALTDELPTTLIGTLISQVASQGEHRDLAWSFLKENFAALAAKQGPGFQNAFPANLLTNFTDAAHATELANFAPAHATSGGQLAAERAYERIMTDADFSAQQLPAVNEWVKRRMARR
jgi:aminopeptidase N